MPINFFSLYLQNALFRLKLSFIYLSMSSISQNFSKITFERLKLSSREYIYCLCLVARTKNPLKCLPFFLLFISSMNYNNKYCNTDNFIQFFIIKIHLNHSSVIFKLYTCEEKMCCTCLKK